MNYPTVNFGQSIFQDTFFVACAQETPYRRLRQLELEIREIENSLITHNFNTRRDIIRKKRLILEIETSSDFCKEEIQIDLEELDWKLLGLNVMVKDAKERLENFKSMRDVLVESVPKSYWDMGFEQAEQQYWEIRISKQLAYSNAIGIPDKAAFDQLMLMPQESQVNIIKNAKKMVLNIQNQEKKALDCNINVETEVITNQTDTVEPSPETSI